MVLFCWPICFVGVVAVEKRSVAACGVGATFLRMCLSID